MQVAVGDVIYIEANSGAVKRVGRSDAFNTEYDLEAEEYVPLPKGEVHKKKEIVQVSHHDICYCKAMNLCQIGDQEIGRLMPRFEFRCFNTILYVLLYCEPNRILNIFSGSPYIHFTNTFLWYIRWGVDLLY